jgi:GT2 family glycosyltransferase
MEQPIDISVCIANWNCQDLLRGCLQSLRSEARNVRLETIVVDNGSTDGAASMVETEFPEAVLIRNSANRGFARANNQAADKARGRYLFFLNNDTVVQPGALRRLLDYADGHPDIGMLGPRLCDSEGHFQQSFRRRPTMPALLHKTLPLRWTGLFKRACRRFRRHRFDQYAAHAVDVLMGAAVLIPRSRFFAFGRWDEDFTFGGEDSELSARINRLAKVVYFPQAEILHFGRASSRLHAGFAASHLAIGWVRYFRKTGHGRLLLLAYKTAVTLDAPLQLTVKSLQAAWRWLSLRPAAAKRSWLVAQGAWHFMTRGFVAFWRA